MLPIFGPGGGRVLFSIAAERDVLHHIFQPLAADAPQPSADLKNLEGAWGKDQPAIARMEWDSYGNDIPFSPLGKAIRDRRLKSAYTDGKPLTNASGECRAPGQPWLFAMYYPLQVYQTNSQVLFLFAYDHAAWPIRIGGKHSDPTAARGHMGDSIGYWDGNTLVVDTVNYKSGLWLDFDGTPASKDVHLQFRIRRLDYNGPKLEIQTTVRDPKMFAADWTFTRTFAWRPDRNVMEEYNCEPQVAEGGAAAYGLSPDPDAEQ